MTLFGYDVIVYGVVPFRFIYHCGKLFDPIDCQMDPHSVSLIKINC